MGLLDFLSLNKNAPDLTPAYTAIMAQARKPDHYGAGGVPDSFDGRFDMLAIHVHLVLRRLRSEGVARDDIGQALFDMFFRDMDQAMREAGVGDMGVGKKVQKMVEAFYGRATAYDAALDADAGDMASGLYDILSRNLYPDAALSVQHETALKALADYALGLETHLASVTLEDIVSGRGFETAPIVKVAHG